MKFTTESIFLPSVDVESLYKFDGDDISHVLGVGINRSGKSTLERNLAIRYIEYGYTVIWREVGKFDFLSRFQSTQDVIDFYETNYIDPKLNKPYSNKDKLLKFWKKYQKKFGDDLVVVIDHPDNIKQHKVNILTYNIMDGITSAELVINQYYEFLRILRIERELNWEKYDLVFVMDEANDIMPPMVKLSVTRNTTKQIQEMCFWLRQWAGYHVRFLLFTHTVYQLRKDARSQCPLVMFKKAEKNDSKEIMQHNLFDLEDDEFYNVYKKIKALPKDEVLYIDKENQYQFIKVFWTERKYNTDECREFIDQFDVKPIVKPIVRDWKEVTRMSKFLITNLDEVTEKKIFYIGYDEKEGKAKLKLRIHQFYNYLFSFDDFKSLWGDHEFIKEYLISGVMVYYEDHNAQELIVEKENAIELLDELRYQYLQGKIDLMEALIQVMEIDSKISNKRLSELLDLKERGVNGSPIWKLRHKDLRKQHTHAINYKDVSLLEYYREIKGVTIKEIKPAKVSSKKSKSKRKSKI